jgi:hypothetical protein
VEPARKILTDPDEAIWNSFIFGFRDWVKSSLRFENPERWLAEWKEELAGIPRLEKEIESLRLQIDVSIQSLLLDEGFNTDEIFELFNISATGIEVIDSNGGIKEWKAKRESYQPSNPKIS